MRKCPNCGPKKMEQNTIRPDCDHQITAENQQMKESIEETSTGAAMQNKLTEDAAFPDIELSGPTEWSKLEDLPLGSVMGLFEKTEPEDGEPSAYDQVTNIEKNEQKEAAVHEASGESGKNQEEALESRQKRRVVELKEIVDSEEENSMPSACIEAYREDTKEEHTKELFKVANEKIVQESKVEPEKGQETEKGSDRENTTGEETVKVKDVKTDITERTEVSTEKQLEEEKTNRLPEAEKKEILESTDKKSTESDETNNESDAGSQSVSKEDTDLEAKVKKEENQLKLFGAEAKSVTITPDTEKARQELNLEKTDPDKTQKKKSKKVPHLALVAVPLFGGGSWAYYDHH